MCFRFASAPFPWRGSTCFRFAKSLRAAAAAPAPTNMPPACLLDGAAQGFDPQCLRIKERPDRENLSGLSWCRWRGSNPHGVTTNGFWVHLVCQFQHTGVCNGHYIIGYRTYSRKSSIFVQVQSFIFLPLCAYSTKAYFVVKVGWRTRSTHHLIVMGILHAFWAFRRRSVFEKFTIDFYKSHLLIYTSTPRGVLKLICLFGSKVDLEN